MNMFLFRLGNLAEIMYWCSYDIKILRAGGVSNICLSYHHLKKLKIPGTK